MPSALIIVCAGIQAKKWRASEHPDEDWAAIESLLGHLANVKAERYKSECRMVHRANRFSSKRELCAELRAS